MVKRLLDIVISATALVIGAPLLLLIALLVLGTMGSPVLFRQQRPGLYGRPFELLKFRTMVSDARIGTDVASDAQRLTRTGRFLRATSLDELPELWNVLRGDMSLVGPRPLLMQYLRRYTPEQARRHTVRPGLTGWAQVNGRNALSWEEKFRLDTWYVDNRSLWLDLKIIMMTVVRLFRPRGISAQGSATMPEFIQPTRGDSNSPPFLGQGIEIERHSQFQGISMSVANKGHRGIAVLSQDLALRPDESWPFYAEDEVEAAANVLRSGNVNQWTGPDVFAFQDACTERFGGGNGIALANGSLALELALKTFGIGPGDEVVVTPRTFVASAFCAMLVGATPVFADVDPDSGNITPATIARVLTDRTKAIIPVHLGGWPADMPGIMALAIPREIKVIEDCAQSQGAAIDGRSAGSFGDAAAFSFCQDKIITTGGEGGFLSFQDRQAWEWAWSFKDHGKSWEKVNTPAVNPGMFRWLHDNVGTNWRLSGPQAAIGLVQLAKLDHWTEARTRNAAIYTQALNDIRGLRVPTPDGGVTHAYYRQYFYIDAPDGEAERLRSEILRLAAEAKLRLFSGSCSEVYREAAFAGLAEPDCPVARALTGRSLAVEVHPTLRSDLTEQRAEALAKIIGEVLG